MSVRLYGRANGYGSHAQVTRGFRAVLTDAGLLEGFVGIDQDDPFAAPPGALARHALFTGPLGALPLARRGTDHESVRAMVAPNSTRIPPALVKQLARVTHVMAPSLWAARVLADELPRYGVPLPIEVVPHGVGPEMRRYPALRQAAVEAVRREHFLVLHMSTTARQRKGTIELLTAWRSLTVARALPARAHLVLVLDVPALARIQEWFVETGGQPANVQLEVRRDMPPEQMAQALSTAHVVCQPSRGEGFGLVPLEARACGVPVVATTCTGHSEHLVEGAPGFVRVESGALGAIDDLADAQAPVVSSDAIAEALRDAVGRWSVLERDAALAADRVAQDWSWHRQLSPLLKALEEA